MKVVPRVVCLLLVACLLTFAVACSNDGYTVVFVFEPESLSRDVDRISVFLIDRCADIPTSQRGRLPDEASEEFVLVKGEALVGLSSVKPGFYGVYAVGMQDTVNCRIAAGCKDHVVTAGGTGRLEIGLVDIPDMGCEDRPDGGTDGSTNDGAREDSGRCIVTGDELCNGLDDDCDDHIDEDYVLATDPDHCGSCENECDEDQGCGDGTCVPMTVEIATGAEHACARRVDGRVLCWGNNNYGQVGLGYTTPSVPLPIRVDGISNVEQVVAGGHSVCARLEDGTARCWGGNYSGQLGNDSFVDAWTPSLVADLTDVRALGPGPLQNCAVLETGRVMCWGSNMDGELGIGIVGQWRTRPQSVLNITNVAQVQGGYGFTCARTVSGSMFCWGRNQYGQLGDGTYLRNATPQPVYGLTDAKHFAPGGGHVCAVREAGEIVCWGDGQFGQLSNTGILFSSVPYFTGMRNGELVSATNPLACALHTNGTVSCWGGTPTPVAGLNDANSISLAYSDNNVCAIRENRNVLCWGKNQAGQLGVGTVDTADHATPVTVLGL